MCSLIRESLRNLMCAEHKINTLDEIIRPSALFAGFLFSIWDTRQLTSEGVTFPMIQWTAFGWNIGHWSLRPWRFYLRPRGFYFRPRRFYFRPWRFYGVHSDTPWRHHRGQKIQVPSTCRPGQIGQGSAMVTSNTASGEKNCAGITQRRLILLPRHGTWGSALPRQRRWRRNVLFAAYGAE